jgi:hypothetical protein
LADLADLADLDITKNQTFFRTIVRFLILKKHKNIEIALIMKRE